ncbi:MAG: aminoacyl-tRNA hydrolase [Candidatus Peregrinibacteria bacterium]|nr:aminoacyl-tRNA hydrolase [Candidatus Peregrinibacteria bacterium]
MKLIVGLGNPGKEYEKTRHNAGFMALDFLAEHYGFEPFKSLDKGKSEMTKGEIAGEKVILLKPQQFMNLSGIATQAVAGYFKIERPDIIAIYDDADIEFGKLRIRTDGSAGGHNGVKSLIEQLGGDDFMRVRLGIKPETPFPGALEDYVLGKLDADQLVSLNEKIKDLPNIIESIIIDGPELAMNKFNN